MAGQPWQVPVHHNCYREVHAIHLPPRGGCFRLAVLASRYDEARQAFAKSPKPYKAARILEDLCACAVKRQEFKEAAYYCYQIAQEILMVRDLHIMQRLVASMLSPLGRTLWLWHDGVKFLRP